ncbi:MAG: nucleotidyl transferase AbiEii/AbiGii toxin family protein [Deltaproteobacteria bacterium]|nr:nucleotidyl transferase AbiEii/AbiGii toxin family protein [Deltaproteobacteria bacterium]
MIARRVRFVLVGGHAVAGHGEPRLTEDLDVFVEPTVVNARRLREALVDFGFGAVAPAVEELARPDRIFMLGRKPWRIDVLTGIDGVSFRTAWASRVEARFEAAPLYVIGRAALLANKLAAGRPKDLLDVAMLEAHAPPRSPARKRAPAKRKRRRPRTQ